MPGESSLSTSEQERLKLVNALRESELLRELSELLASSLDPAHILQVLVKRTTEVCDVERCTVWLLDEARDLYLPAASHLVAPHLDRKSVQHAEYIWPQSSLPAQDPVLLRLVQENGMLALNDLRQADSETMQSIAKQFYVRSILLVSLQREGRPVGLMSLDNPGKTHCFSPAQQQLARDIGQQAAIAIHNARLYQQAQEERKRAERLIERAQSIYRVAMAVNSGEDLPAILEIALQHLIHDLGAKGATIALVDDKTDSLSLASTIHLSPPSPHIPHTIALEALPHCHKAAMEELPCFVSQEELTGEERHWYQQLGMEHVMIVPLMVGSHNSARRTSKGALLPATSTHCVGFAFIDYPQAMRQPPPGHFAFALDIAAQCALAIEKTHILAEARRAAALATEHANTLDAVFNAMTEGIVVLNMEGQVIISNKTATQFLGLPREAKPSLTEILQDHPAYTLRGRSILPSEFPLFRALRGEAVNGERFLTKRADDSERAIEVNVAPLFDSEAQQMGVVGAFRDVTQQVRVEQRIRRALDTMLHAAEAISGITDIKDILHSVLSMSLTALNCDRGMVQLYDEERATFSPLLSLGFTQESEAHWLEEQAAWLTPGEGEYSGFRDQLLEGHATLVNAEQCPEQAHRFRNTMVLAAPITHNGHFQGVLLLDRSSFLSKEQEQPAERRPHFQPAFSIWDIAVVEGIARLAGLAIEQARWQQEAETARTNEAIMREANSLKDEFLAITAHEFRTPLTVVLVHSQMMARLLRKAANIDPMLNEKLQDSLSTIEVQAHQLTNIVNTFLEVTRLNRGQIELNRQEVNLEHIVKQVVASHAATSTMHQISCTIEPADQPYLVFGDNARLLQVFANLLQNAIKYSPLGGPITITLAQRIDDEEKIVEVRIRDRGIGIPPDAQPHLFERFYRAPNIQGSRTRGVGLGLYVVAQFIRLHGGTIRVESSGVAGEGSCFIFTLPLLAP